MKSEKTIQIKYAGNMKSINVSKEEKMQSYRMKTFITTPTLRIEELLERPFMRAKQV